MGNKSLTEVAKTIMMAESNDSGTSNSKTLKPNSKSVDSIAANPGAKPEVDKADLVDTAPVTVPGPTKGKDTSKSSQSRAGTVPGEQSRVKTPGSKNSEREIMEDEELDEDVIEEEFEISEELADFIDQKIEEGLSEEEIAEAIEENFEMISEEEDLEEEDLEEEDAYDKNRYAVKNGKATRAPLKSSDEKDAQHHVWANSEEEAIRLHANKSKKMEEEEQLDEISPEKLGRYIRAASKDMDATNAAYSPKADKKTRMANVNRSTKRALGIPKAINKLTGREIFGDDEEIDEEYYQVDMSEDIEALFSGEELSEDFKFKAQTIFESAVERKVREEIERIEEAYAETLEEQVVEIQEELSSNVDDYLNYVVEQWVLDNEVAIEAGLRNELTEEFITGLRHLFAEHYIDIPEDKVHVVEELGSKVSELELKLNEEIDRNVQLSKNLNESARFEILVDMCEGLTSTQAEKLKSLSEGIDFRNPEDFVQKIGILKESYFTTNVSNEKVLDSDSVEDGKMISEEVTGRMAVYSRALGRK